VPAAVNALRERGFLGLHGQRREHGIRDKSPERDPPRPTA
jgi:hypothetical protein